MRHVCMVPGCHEPGRHAVTLRVRRPDTTAVIAPNTGAYLCDRHAESGFEMDIVLRPNETRRAEIFTWADDGDETGHVERAIAEITGSAAGRRGAGSSGAAAKRRVTRPR
jgi:hypothetical protein